MIIAGWLVVFLLGLSVLNTAAPKIGFLEKIGFAMPLGMGINSLLMFAMDLAHIKINNPYVLLSVASFISMALGIYMFTKNRQVFSVSDLLKNNSFVFPPINLAWMLIMGYIAYLMYEIVNKSLFWPPFQYDTIYGYDFLAKAIAHEGTLHNSIFSADNPIYSLRSLYPPLFPLNLSFAYILGHQSSQIVVVFYYISICISFYALLKKYTTHLGAAFFSLLLIMTPEFAAFSSLSSPNPPCALYSAIGMLCLYIYYKEDERSYLFIGSVFIILALWTRTEIIVFAIAGAALLLRKSIDKKQFTTLFIFIGTCTAVVIAWQWYMRTVLGVDPPQEILTQMNWDPKKFSLMFTQIRHVTFSTLYYGLTVYLFLIAVGINIPHIIRKKENTLLQVLIFVTWGLYVLVYYQLDTDYTDTSMGGWIMSGYKRGLFYFFPLMLFYCANNRIVNGLFKKQLSL